jgi:hypothetical protein
MVKLFVPVTELAVVGKVIALSEVKVKGLFPIFRELLKIIFPVPVLNIVSFVPVKVTALLKVKLPLLVVILPGI